MNRIVALLTPRLLAFVGLLMAFLAFGWSRALLSISVGFVAGAAVLHLLKPFRPLTIRNSFGWVLTLLFVLSLAAGLYTEDRAGWLADLRQKLPMLILGVSMTILPPFTRLQYRLLFYVFILTLTVLALASLGVAYQDYEALIRTVSRNSNIDIVGSISHIYFGILLATSVILALGMLISEGEALPRSEKILLLSLALLDALLMHLLTTRTGLLSLYAGLLALLLGWMVRSGKKRLAMLMLAGLILLPLLSYQFVPSFRLRVQVTRYDWQQYQNPEADLSAHSLSARLIAWEATWRIFLAQPLTGTGLADIEPSLQAAYLAQPPRARIETLPKSPHNQFLEYMAGFGLPGLTVLLFVCLYPLIFQRKKMSPLYISFVLIA
ncbi:MAG: O-antigen ligase domain-containing protein, partial [Bacteroidetes bacterium]